MIIIIDHSETLMIYSLSIFAQFFPEYIKKCSGVGREQAGPISYSRLLYKLGQDFLDSIRNNEKIDFLERWNYSPHWHYLNIWINDFDLTIKYSMKKCSFLDLKGRCPYDIYIIILMCLIETKLQSFIPGRSTWM